VRIDVVDSGIGIAPCDRERIFDEFVQVGTGARRDTGHGMGLGLAIVRRLCGLLLHSLALVSTPGRGSRFSVTAPRVVRRRRFIERVDAAQESGCGDMLAARFTGRLVVIVDDDPMVVDAMCTLFASWGSRVAGGDDAPAVLDAIGASVPDLVVADLRLANGRSGIVAIADLRRAVGHVTAALIVSGDTGDAARSEAHAAGITMLAKPVVAAALRNAAEVAITAARRGTAAPRENVSRPADAASSFAGTTPRAPSVSASDREPLPSAPA
jgi:CheY-like chemotaxis protein